MAKKDWVDAIRELGKAVDAWEGCTTNVAERAQVLAERGYAFVNAERPSPANDDLLRAWTLARGLPDAKLRGAIAYNLGLAAELEKSDQAVAWFAISNDVNPTSAAELRIEASSCGAFGSAGEVKGTTSTDVCPTGTAPFCALPPTSGEDGYGDLSMIGVVTLLDVDGPTTWSYPAGRGGLEWRCAGFGTSSVSGLADGDYLVVTTQAVLSGPGASPTGGTGCAALVDLTSVAVVSRKKHARIALRETFLKGGKPYCPTTP